MERIALPVHAADVPHRDDFVMNSIGGGDFHGYILEHILEGEALYRPMRTFGTMHNVMHILGRLDPETGAMEEFDLPAGARPHSVYIGPDGTT